MFPLIINNLQSTMATTGAEENYVQIVEARINLDLGALGANVESSLTRFRYPAFKVLSPGEDAALQVLVIPEATAKTIGSLLVADGTAIIRVKLKFMYKHGGFERETNEIEYPVQVCNGCLIQANYSCSGGTLPASIPSGNTCNYTDDPVVCCDAGGACPVCPAVATTVH
jgi:hypothetical protein